MGPEISTNADAETTSKASASRKGLSWLTSRVWAGGAARSTIVGMVIVVMADLFLVVGESAARMSGVTAAAL